MKNIKAIKTIVSGLLATALLFSSSSLLAIPPVNQHSCVKAQLAVPQILGCRYIKSSNFNKLGLFIKRGTTIKLAPSDHCFCGNFIKVPKTIGCYVILKYGILLTYSGKKCPKSYSGPVY